MSKAAVKKDAKKTFARADWVAEARRVLVRSGVEAVKVDRLAKTLKVTRGSFYWHFESRQDLLDNVLEDWLVQNRSDISEIESSWTSKTPSVADFLRLWLRAEREVVTFDQAMRMWARQEPDVAVKVQAIDGDWIALLERLFMSRAFSEDEAIARARVMYFHQIGYHALLLEETLTDRIKMVEHYNRVLMSEELDEEAKALLADLLKHSE
ncbi:MAG: helix-turn-helix domain-containing protein [Pseudomonadota bacterium]